MIIRCDTTVSGDGRDHVRHTRHVSIIYGSNFKVVCGIPAKRRILSREPTETCHHRRCNLRNNRRASPSSATRNCRRVAVTSNAVQSVGRAVCALLSSSVCRWRSPMSGPRLAGCVGGTVVVLLLDELVVAWPAGRSRTSSRLWMQTSGKFGWQPAATAMMHMAGELALSQARALGRSAALSPESLPKSNT